MAKLEIPLTPKEQLNKTEAALLTRMEADNKAIFHIPKLLGHAENARSSIELFEPDEKHKYPSVRVTLPKGCVIEGKDLSYYKFYVSPSQVKSYIDAAGKEASHYEVSLPFSDKEGNNKTLLLFKDLGHWENPDGKTKEEKGNWIDEGRDEVTIPTGALALAATSREMQVRAYVRNQHKERSQEQSLDNLAQEARTASKSQVQVEHPQHEQQLEK